MNRIFIVLPFKLDLQCTWNWFLSMVWHRGQVLVFSIWISYWPRSVIEMTILSLIFSVIFATLRCHSSVHLFLDSLPSVALVCLFLDFDYTFQICPTKGWGSWSLCSPTPVTHWFKIVPGDISSLALCLAPCTTQEQFYNQEKLTIYFPTHLLFGSL